MKKERFNYRWKKQTKKSKHHPQKGFPNCRGKESGETLVIMEVRQWVGKQVICKSLKALLND